MPKRFTQCLPRRIASVYYHPVVAAARLKVHLEAWSQDQEIVAYCRGPYCVLAYETVAQLRKKGHRP